MPLLHPNLVKWTCRKVGSHSTPYREHAFIKAITAGCFKSLWDEFPYLKAVISVLGLTKRR